MIFLENKFICVLTGFSSTESTGPAAGGSCLEASVIVHGRGGMNRSDPDTVAERMQEQGWSSCDLRTPGGAGGRSWGRWSRETPAGASGGGSGPASFFRVTVAAAAAG